MSHLPNPETDGVYSASPRKEATPLNKIILGLALILITGCSQQPASNTSSTAALEAEITQLKAAIDDLKPGLGETMGVIQQHHAKLYLSLIHI